MAEAEALATITTRQEKAILALLSEATIRRASDACQVPEKTIYRWLKERDFQAEYRAARREATSQAIARLQQASAGAAGVLIALAGKDTTPAAVRLAAASKILDIAVKSVELEDLAARLEILEAKYAT